MLFNCWSKNEESHSSVWVLTSSFESSSAYRCSSGSSRANTIWGEICILSRLSIKSFTPLIALRLIDDCTSELASRVPSTYSTLFALCITSSLGRFVAAISLETRIFLRPIRTALNDDDSPSVLAVIPFASWIIWTRSRHTMSEGWRWVSSSIGIIAKNALKKQEHALSPAYQKGHPNNRFQMFVLGEPTQVHCRRYWKCLFLGFVSLVCKGKDAWTPTELGFEMVWHGFFSWSWQVVGKGWCWSIVSKSHYSSPGV